MIDTVLFDLDGTLLPIDMECFTKIYFHKLSLKFKDYFEKDEFIQYVWDATKYMVADKQKDKTNAQAFMQRFQKHSIYNLDELMPLFDEFYDREFDSLSCGIEPNPLIPKIVENVKHKGYQMVIATNPMFPYSAIVDRIRWSGLDPDDFALITAYEDMHYCKPHIEYFEELLDKIGKTPSECIMIGNDVQEDIIAAGSLGIKTFLLKDFEINRTGEKSPTDFSGTYEDLFDFVAKMPVLNGK
ncbi:MAG: HAD family hydrolase [Clostridia bacterium]|nr:HAD family hydrolase [Clostridia bacterium]